MEKLHELVPISNGYIGNQSVSLVSAKRLHAFLCVGRDFTSWIKGRIGQYGFVASVDYIVVENLSSPKRGSSKSRQQVEHDYLITVDMGKELAMVERNERGREIRRYFIRCEQIAKSAPSIPQSLPEALRLAAELAEKATDLQNQLIEAAPKVEFANQVAGIRKGISIPNYAKTIGVGPVKLFDWMRRQGILITGGHRHNLPMQRHIDSGYFCVRQGTYQANGEARASFTTMLTGKGEQWLTRRLIAGGVLSEVPDGGSK